MSLDREHLEKRNEEIKQVYIYLIKEGYDIKFILNRLSDKFYLAPRTIRGIVSGELDREKQNKPE